MRDVLPPNCDRVGELVVAQIGISVVLLSCACLLVKSFWNLEGQKLGIELLDEHSPLKHFMHRADAVIGGVIVLAAAYFVWSRVKVYKQYKLEAAATKAVAATAKAD